MLNIGMMIRQVARPSNERILTLAVGYTDAAHPRRILQVALFRRAGRQCAIEMLPLAARHDRAGAAFDFQIRRARSLVVLTLGRPTLNYPRRAAPNALVRSALIPDDPGSSANPASVAPCRNCSDFP